MYVYFKIKIKIKIRTRIRIRIKIKKDICIKYEIQFCNKERASCLFATAGTISVNL